VASKPTKSSSGPSLTLTVSQAAERLGVSVGTVRRWADKGHLQSFRTPGGQRRFDAAHIEGFLTSLEQGPGARGRRRDDR
jgi:excisionase family DNA binding protein